MILEEMALVASFDRRRTLTELEDDDWEPPEDPTSLVSDCHSYRHIPIAELTPEQLSTLVSQGIGMPHLAIPLIEMLERDPWVVGDFGTAVLPRAATVSRNHLFWMHQVPLLERLLAVLGRMANKAAEATAIDPDVVDYVTWNLRRTVQEVRDASIGLTMVLRCLTGTPPSTRPGFLEDWARPSPIDQILPADGRPRWVCGLELLETDPLAGKFRGQLMRRAVNTDNDLFWLSRRSALRRILTLLEQIGEDEELRDLVNRWHQLHDAESRFDVLDPWSDAPDGLTDHRD